MPFISVATTFRDLADASRQLSNAINALGRGRSNATGTVTLATGTALTTISDVNIGESSAVLFTPTGALAAAESIYVSAQANESVSITHANDTTTRTFAYAVQG